MKGLSTQKVFDLLGTQNIAGNPEQIKKLCVRIDELAQMNGEDWVRRNRRRLLKEWQYAIKHGYIR